MDASTAGSERRFEIQNQHGEKLVGVLNDAGSKKVVILCHGFRASKDDNIMVNLSAALTKNGISTFRFDFSGNGESEGKFEYGNYRKEADDLHSVVSFLSHNNYEIIAIVGHSKGGDVVLLYASIYNDVKMVLNLSGRFDLKRGIQERFGEDLMQKIETEGFIDVKDKEGIYKVTKESLMDRLNTNMPEQVKAIKEECRVLTVHGTEDEIISVGDAHEFAMIIPNHKLQIINGADHCYTSHQTELASAVVDFITS
ncbi:hypothetical protein LUZ60_008583 [Juncus effusus]|nr:hypothetical protein LUZ60_008583 [Juncus effusus]